MTRATELAIAKYHGTGNDFVMVLDLEDARPIGPALAAALCDRRFGVGGDGVIRVTRDRDGADLFMDYRNADGSLAEMCGNGIRCLAAYAVDRGVLSGPELSVGTRAGRKRLTLDLEAGSVRSATVAMGAPAFERKAIPMAGPEDDALLAQPFLAPDGATYVATAVSMGNPHLVLHLDADPATAPVTTLGPAFERDPRFPEGVNVEFAQARDGVVVTRVWERGVGETKACGTGACAVLVATHAAGLTPARTTVRFPGGDLVVERTEDEVYLTGPAERTFEGVVPASWFAVRGLA